MISRRDFIFKSGLVSAAGMLPVSFFMPPEPETGLILYTVRNEMDTDPEGTLKLIADIGYTWLEAANYSEGLLYNQKPAVFKRMVEDYGMKLISSHAGINPDNIDRVISDSHSAGLKYLILPSLPSEWRKSIDSYKKAADFFNLAGVKCKNAGIRFGFHNHTVEFKPMARQIPYDILLNSTDPELVTFELDLCWITASGNSAVTYINNYPGRFELFHMKDMTSRKRDATMGEGIIDFEPIFDLMKIAGLKYFFVEQDNCKTHSPLESIRISREYLLANL